MDKKTYKKLWKKLNPEKVKASYFRYAAKPEVKARRSAAGKKRYAANKEAHKLKCRNDRLLREYGLSAYMYDLMLESQGRVCQICKRPGDSGRKHLVVDHCHTTGKVRGLLCSTCNLSLAMFERGELPTWHNFLDYLDGTRVS